MKAIPRLLSIVSVLLLLAAPLHAENPAPLSQEQIEAIALRPASSWGHTGSNVCPEMIPLFKEESIELGGNTVKYRLHVPENYPVDRNRITVSGLSTGGDGTWRALERRPDLFAAAVPLVSWSPLTDAAMEQSPILKKIPIWAIYSSDDRSIDHARAEFERVEKTGANVKKTEFGICGHNAWTPAMLQADIFAWLLSRAKDGERYYAVYDPGVDPDDLKGIVDVATRDTSSAPALAPAVGPTVIEHSVAERLREMREERMERVGVSPPVPVEPATGGLTPPALAPPAVEQMNRHREQAYILLAKRYFMTLDNRFGAGRTDEAAANLERFTRVFRRLSPPEQMNVIMGCLGNAQTAEAIEVLEKLLDGMSLPLVVPQRVFEVRHARAIEFADDSQERGGVSPPVESATAICAERIIEECDRPWAMTSESLYGMFPADWGKEAEAIPDFIMNSASDELSHRLARSVSEDPESRDFVAACRSILLLQHRPMSSPWFETSGGRLRSEIQYELSSKGEMFVRFLRVVRDSAGNSDKARELSIVAARTLEKIEMVLAKD